MATKYINSITYGGDEYKFVDDSSGYTSPEVFVVNATITTMSQGIPTGGTTDKSSQQIYAAATSGLLPVVAINLGDTYMVASLAWVIDDIDASQAVFVYEDQSNPTFKYATLTVTNSTFTLTFKTGFVENDSCLISASAPLSIDGATGEIANNTTIGISLNDIGNIKNNGTLQTSDIAIATGDKLVVTDNSDSGKVARASIGFDTSDTSKYLRHDGTWQTVSGGVTDVKVDNVSIVSSGVASLVTSSSHPYNASTNALATMADIGAAGGGTVTSVGLSNATNGGLTISGSPVTSSGSITVGHTNVLANAQTTSAVYPIKIDKNGHISEYGSAVTIPTVTDSYSSTGTNAVSGKAVNAALQTLDSSVTATTGEAISAITITDGKITSSSKIAVGTGTVTGVTAGSGLSGGTISTSGTIALDTAYGDTVNPYGSKTANQVLAAPNGSNGTPSFRALASADIPALGNIQNTGALQTNDVAIATGDKLVVTDSSDSSKVARASISFDTSNTTDYLRKDGTWQTVSGGSSDVLMVTLSYSNSTYSIDSTYDDILQAVSDGKFVYLYDAVSSWSNSSMDGFIIAPLSLHYPSEPAENEYYLYFVSSYTVGGNISFCRYSVDYDNYVSANDSVGVTSATSATSATNATNAYVTATNPTSGTIYYPPFVDGTGNQGMKQNDGLKYMSLQGTASANGYGILRLGNTTNSGTAGNKYGAIDIYPKTGAYYGRLLTADTLGANRTYTLPNASGTVALTSNIPKISVQSSQPTGTASGDLWVKI